VSTPTSTRSCPHRRARRATRSWRERWSARLCALATTGFLIFADLWPGYDTTYGVFATLIVAVVWLWLTNVSVLLGGVFAHEWSRIGPR
jgi:membrane protein